VEARRTETEKRSCETEVQRVDADAARNSAEAACGAAQARCSEADAEMASAVRVLADEPLQRLAAELEAAVGPNLLTEDGEDGAALMQQTHTIGCRLMFPGALWFQLCCSTSSSATSAWVTLFGDSVCRIPLQR